MIITPKDDIYVISKVTGIRYKVYEMWLEGTKIKEYYIENLSGMEWWKSSRFEGPFRRYSHCKCCRCRCECYR